MPKCPWMSYRPGMNNWIAHSIFSHCCNSGLSCNSGWMVTKLCMRGKKYFLLTYRKLRYGIDLVASLQDINVRGNRGSFRWKAPKIRFLVFWCISLFTRNSVFTNYFPTLKAELKHGRFYSILYYLQKPRFKIAW